MPYKPLDRLKDGGRGCSICGVPADWQCNTARYCTKHMRILRMRLTARDRGLSVPTIAELEALVEASNGLRCGCCDVQMVWTRREDSRRVCTLQHNADGTHSLWCIICNIRDGAAAGRHAVERFVAGIKRCFGCGLAKPRADFLRQTGYVKRSAARCRACADAIAARRSQRKAGAA